MLEDDELYKGNDLDIEDNEITISAKQFPVHLRECEDIDYNSDEHPGNTLPNTSLRCVYDTRMRKLYRADPWGLLIDENRKVSLNN